LLDCGAFITALTLAATATGVASIPQAAIAGLAPVVREFLRLSSTRNIVCAVSFGYPDTNNPVNKFRTTRATMQDVVKGSFS
jgi:nitroreductase